MVTTVRCTHIHMQRFITLNKLSHWYRVYVDYRNAFPAAVQFKTLLQYFKNHKRWSVQMDSNHWPHAYQACTLPSELCTENFDWECPVYLRRPGTVTRRRICKRLLLSVGKGRRVWTLDLRFWRPRLYQLSYSLIRYFTLLRFLKNFYTKNCARAIFLVHFSLLRTINIPEKNKCRLFLHIFWCSPK